MALETPHQHRLTLARRRRGAGILAFAVLAVGVLSAWGVAHGGEEDGSVESQATAPQGPPGSTSQNGWAAVSDSSDVRLVSFPWVTGQVLDGDVTTVLAYFAGRFDAEVETIDVASSWGWAHRPVRGHDDTLSNHASGTAIDLNATIHPLGSTGTFSDEQIARLRDLLDELAPVLAWGGDFERPDEMHFEIVGTPEQVAEVAARVAGG